MILSGKTTFWCAIAFCIACLPSDTQVSAKNTPDPTPRPTPVPTALPSKFPSFSPTATPTASPSKTHTDLPTQIPTNTVPNDHFIYSDGVVYSLLPEIAFRVFIPYEYVSTETIQSLFDDFLGGVLEEISNSYGLDYSHVDSDGEISTSSQIQLLPGTDYRIRMDGFVYFFNKAPTSESLKQSLNVYFSFWGLSELQDYLTSAGIDKADVISISVGDENVSFVSNTVPKESQGERNSGSAIRNFFFWDGELSKTNIVMVYTGFVVLTVVIALIVCRYRAGRRRMKQGKEEQQSQEGDSTKTSHDDEDEERGPASKIPSKAPSRRNSSTDQSISFQGVEASKKLPMIREKEIKRGEENTAGIPDSTIGKTVKQSTCKESENKKVDKPKKIPNSKKKKLLLKNTGGGGGKKSSRRGSF